MREGPPWREDLAAIIPAAGASSRMGRPKALLALGPERVVERVIGSLRAAGVGTLVAIMAADGPPLLRRSFEHHGVTVLVSPDPDLGMIASIRQAARWLSGRELSRFFVLPVDHPLVKVSSLEALLRCGDEGEGLVCKPVCGGRRGHPPLLDGSLLAPLADFCGEGGLRTFLRSCGPCDELSLDDEGIRLDLDLPVDYERALDLVAGEALPTVEEEEAFWAARGREGEAPRRHGETVARVALQMGQFLRRNDPSLDLALVAAASRLHDLFKGRSFHEQRAAQLMRRLGFHGLAAVISAHVDLPPSARGRLDERGLVHLADKCVQGTGLVDPEQRFQAKLERFAGEAEPRRAVERRRTVAFELVDVLEGRGLPLADLLEGAT